MGLEETMSEKCIDYLKELNRGWNDESNREKYGRPPREMIVEYYDAVCRTAHHYKQILCKRWEYRNEELIEVSTEKEIEDNPRNGIFFKIASARFYWDLDRNKAFIGMTYGPRYGVGYSFDIKYEGEDICLENEQVEWIS